MASVAAYTSKIKIGGTSTAFTNLATTTSDNKTFQIQDSTKRILDPDTTVVVEGSIDSGTTWEALPAGYIVDYLFGKVVYQTAQAVGLEVRFSSGNYIPTSVVATAHRHRLNCMNTLIDNTTNDSAQATGYKSRQFGLQDVQVTLGMFDDDIVNAVNPQSQVFQDAVDNRTPLLIEIQPGGSGPTFRGWLLIEHDNASGDVSQLEQDEVVLSAEGSAHANFGWDS